MNELNKNIESLKEQIFKLNPSFDISKNFLPDQEIVKNIIASKSKYSKEDIILMVDGVKKNSNDIKEKTNQLGSSGTSGLSNLNNIPVDQAKKGEELKGVAAKVYPIPKDNPYYKEAQDKKSKVRLAVTKIMRESKSIASELSNTTLSIANSIPAIVVLATTLPAPNINAAISLACLCISQVMKLIDRISDVFLYLDDIKDLKLLVAPDIFKSITTPINAAILALTNLLKPISALKSTIDSLISKISDATNPANLQSKIESLNSQISDKNAQIKKLEDLGVIPSNEGQGLKLSILIKERSELISSKSSLEKTKKVEASDFDKIQKEIENQIKETNKVVINNYLYDIKLPDGTILKDQTDEDISKIAEKYKIVYQNG